MNARRLSRMFRAWVRRSGPQSFIFRRRIALMGGAVLVGLTALVFAALADLATGLFERLYAALPLLPLVLTPLSFMAILWATRRFAPAAAGSGIPQVIAATRNADPADTSLLSIRTACVKAGLTIGALLSGASVGREGPTVQLSAAIMGNSHRWLRVPVQNSAVIAGGAAGVAAAFNTPLGGIAFAIEELASAYEQRTTLLVIGAVIVSGMVALGLSGNYVYFGTVRHEMAIGPAMLLALVAGLAGGVAGGLFSRLLQACLNGTGRLASAARARPLLWAAGCGLVVAVIGCVTHITWGTGYAPARALVLGEPVPTPWFAPAKFVSTLATAMSGMPGGIFAPSLSIGAGLGDIVHRLMPDQPLGPVVLLGMAAYFTGVVRAPLTAVIIIAETTGSRSFMLPLLLAAVIADAVSAIICREKLYHALSRRFIGQPTAPPPKTSAA